MRTLPRWGVALACAALLLGGCTSGSHDMSGMSGTAPANPSATSSGMAGMSMTEYPIGQPQRFEIAAVSAAYSKPADMEPAGMGLSAANADVHLEANVTALQGNKVGFTAGSWIPYLTIDYQITAPNGKVTKGSFMPMTSAHGQHYGANVKLGDAGTYKLQYTVHSPTDNGLMVHVDPTNGVTGSFWDAPLVASWDFDYLPRDW
ncbi:iron transporter [Propionicimonas sp.]|uniref:iron transporter n=1 Tax=Propionicimonas sp. TaxID=1955623 RepID=UPI0039E4CC69